MEYSVQLTNKAEEDLDRIFRYLAVEIRNLKAATRIMNAIESAIQQLRIFPEGGEIVRNRYVEFLPIRKKIVVRYVLYYVFDVSTKSVTIIRVGHQLQQERTLLE